MTEKMPHLSYFQLNILKTYSQEIIWYLRVTEAASDQIWEAPCKHQEWKHVLHPAPTPTPPPPAD